MFLTALATGIITAALVLGGLILILLWTRNRIKVVFTGLVSSPGPDQPSPAALVTDQVAQVLASRLASQLKATLMGTESGISRNQAAIETELMAGSNPVLGAVLANFPGIRKRLTKNPGLAPLVQAAAEKFLAGVGKNGSNHQDGGSIKSPFK